MRSFATIAIAATLLASAAVPAVAEIEIEEVVRIARDNGVVLFREVELDDGRWEVEGRDAEGRKLEIDISAADGRVIKIDHD